MNITILGGGIAAISLSYFLQKNKKIKKITILEKENKLGGLLRSYNTNGIWHDVGPHIIFSKNKKILKIILNILKNNKTKLKRSNKIIYDKDTFIKYPFENELYKLPKKDLKFALKYFLDNSFSNINPKTMKDFFLKNFGKGIFDLYLGPYNNKIWKMNTSKLDTQMVERIPRPPREDILKSARGIKTEGYKHQLYFHYPKKGGIESLFNSFLNKLDNKKVEIHNNIKIKKINYAKKNYQILTNKRKFISNKVFSTIPLNNFYKLFTKNDKLKKVSNKLQYNSIIIAIVNIKGNVGGKNFALMVPNRNIIFHRLSKLDFLGSNYSKTNSTTFEIEITYRRNSKIYNLSKSEVYKKIFNGLKELHFIKKKKDVLFKSIKKFEYAYVIYNLNHRKCVNQILNYYKKKGFYFLGRWGSWEYLNSDQVISQACNLASNFNEKNK